MNSTFILRKNNSAKLLFFTLLICISCGHYYDSIAKEPLLKNEIKKNTTIHSFKWKNRLLININQNNLNFPDYKSEEFINYDLILIDVLNDDVFVNDLKFKRELFFKNSYFKNYDFNNSNIILVGKDGKIKKKYSHSNFEINNVLSTIDAMPMRIYEKNNK